ncbi:GNAT family N-acetyltransferase [Paenibacillus tengchongensis]|uniref:GNAT family N-acetyltransferase n=1 Tax=Paenibacillus tengchongensis TaxID=2608684 RepID=UPI00124CB509|nr:GNAT family N-acetyltransferase [Paenibacillus tengchongensis]
MGFAIRELTSSDASELLALQHSLDEESAFMMLEPGERKRTVQQVESMIRGYAEAPNSLLIGAETAGKLAGYLSAGGGEANRIRHSAYLVTGVLREYQGMGIGSALFCELDTWARRAGMVRLELTVMVHNERAIALYTKNGFEIEGLKKKSLKVDGAWVDEYYMGKILQAD